jgi:hypothetical protein
MLHEIESIVPPGPRHYPVRRMELAGGWLYWVEPAGGLIASSFVPLANVKADDTVTMHSVEDIVTPGPLNAAYRLRVPGGWLYWIMPVGGVAISTFVADPVELADIATVVSADWATKVEDDLLALKATPERVEQLSEGAKAMSGAYADCMGRVDDAMLRIAAVADRVAAIETHLTSPPADPPPVAAAVGGDPFAGDAATDPAPHG